MLIQYNAEWHSLNAEHVRDYTAFSECWLRTNGKLRSPYAESTQVDIIGQIFQKVVIKIPDTKYLGLLMANTWTRILNIFVPFIDVLFQI